jgi:ribonuclease HII
MATAGPRPLPSRALERALWSAGVLRVAGVDEVGRGPLAGPVYAAAVILDPRKRPRWVSEVRDSKVLPAPERERLAEVIKKEAPAWGIGWASVAEIDAWGISRANWMAMSRALNRLQVEAEHVLVDGPLLIKGCDLKQQAVVDGDATCASIAAASIVAKVARDSVMCWLDRWHPEYGFASHKGYATPSHLRSIEVHGLSPHHRRSWAAVARRSSSLLLVSDSLVASPSPGRVSREGFADAAG